MSEFFQQPPRAGNRFNTDPSLRLFTQWHLPEAIYGQAQPQLERMGALNKLACARQAAQAGSELVKSFGGAGYVEDTGIPRLFRNLHVHRIWEGTTSVLAHDVLRALRASENAEAFADASRISPRPEPRASSRGSKAGSTCSCHKDKLRA